MIQRQFADKVTGIVKTDNSLIGLAVAGSWLTNEIDEFSDLDLIKKKGYFYFWKR
jgi:hypothetical protein